MAHEVDNPLGSILGYTSILARADTTQEETQDYLRRIEKEIERINRIVKELPNYARPSRVDIQEVEINRVIEETLSLLSYQKSFKNIETRLSLHPDLPVIRGNESLLSQIFINIILNAVDAMPDGGTITIETFMDGNTVVIKVADDGRGIPADIKERIFDPFFTTKGSQSAPRRHRRARARVQPRGHVERGRPQGPGRGRIAALPADAPKDAWIVGRGWIETHWPEQRFPTRADLDAIAPDHPVYLTRADGHASVANSKALALGGVTRATKAPAGGAILRDARGEPTGMLIDDAQALVEDRIVGAEVDPVAALTAAIAREQRLGWTGVQDAGLSWAVVDRMRALCAKGELGLRWYAALDAPSADADRLIAQGPVLGECDGRITVRALKFYMDGQPPDFGGGATIIAVSCGI